MSTKKFYFLFSPKDGLELSLKYFLELFAVRTFLLFHLRRKRKGKKG